MTHCCPSYPSIEPSITAGDRGEETCPQAAGPDRIFALIQARLSSRRLPGKVLKPLLGKPVLAHLLDRMALVSALDGIAVVTSDQPDDDAVEHFVRNYGVTCLRGPLDDVLRRYVGAARALEATAVVRICGDSPLLHPALIDHALSIFRQLRPDMVSNVLHRTFPKGQSVEVITRPALDLAYERASEPDDREHVTRWFYGNSANVRIVEFQAAVPAPGLQLSIDTPEDFQNVERLLRELGDRALTASLDEIIAAAQVSVQR